MALTRAHFKPTLTETGLMFNRSPVSHCRASMLDGTVGLTRSSQSMGPRLHLRPLRALNGRMASRRTHATRSRLLLGLCDFGESEPRPSTWTAILGSLLLLCTCKAKILRRLE